MEENNCVECECGGPMFPNRMASDEVFLQCQECGETQQMYDNEDEGFDFTGTYDGGTTYVHEDGEGAKTSGVKYNRATISEGRKAGKGVIETLCSTFNASRLEKEMLNIFKLLKAWRNLTAVAAAVFISVYRREQPISIKQVLPVLNVTPPVTMSLLGVAVKRVEKYRREMLPAPPQLSTEPTTTWEAGSTKANPEIDKHARSVLPNLKVQDPFMSSLEITERVYNITNKIVTLFERRTKRSFDRRIITIAAGFLAWQSCHYHDKHHNSQVPFTELREPKEKSDYQKYLTLTNLGIDDLTARSVRRSVTLLSKELLQLFKHMTWIPKIRKCKYDIPKYLEVILKFQGMTTDALKQEEEMKRLNEPIIAPIIPRELTAEEVAILDAPELSEKDLPDAELNKYLRSDLELNPVNVHLSFSANLDSDLAELKKKRQSKQQQKKKSKSK